MVMENMVDPLRRRFIAVINDFREDDSGATSIEYGLIVSLIFLAIVASVRAFTSSASEMYGTIDAAMENE